MKSSPIVSKFLSGYAILFAGLAPTALVLIAFFNGVDLFFPVMLGNIVMGCAIVYYGGQVFAGHVSAVRIFAIFVAIHYLALSATNLWNFPDYPAGSRAAEMAIPRMIRGVLFASVYLWYYLMRSRTRQGFQDATE